MKKKKVIRWLLLFAGLGLALFIGAHFLLHFGGWGHRGMAVWQNGGTKVQVFHRGMMRQGHFGRMGGMMGGMGMMGAARHIARVPAIFGLGSIIVALIIAAIGWLLRKNAKGSMGMKWGGSLLMVIAVLMILRRALPLVLFIIAGLVIWKLIANSKKKDKVAIPAADPSFESMAPVSSSTGRMLDEWERNISKEEH